MSRSILVSGATGNQGGAVVAALAAVPYNDFVILALTRDVNSAKAQALAKKYNSVRLVAGDLNNTDAIFKAIGTEVWGVFSVQNPFGGGDNTLESEVKQGKALIDSALKNNVKHFVYTSVDRGGDAKSDKGASPVPHFETKRQIEIYLRAKASKTPMQYTILRPVFFMDNLTTDMQGKLMSAAWKSNVDPKRLQLVSVTDIGFFAAQAFASPAVNAGRAISIAGDELSQSEASAIWKQQTGHAMPIGLGLAGWMLLKAIKDLGLMFKWFREEGYGADIASLKRENPNLTDFKTWVAQNRK